MSTMDREQYTNEIRKISRDKNFRGFRLPQPLFEFGWEISKHKPYSWIQERVKFWLYAYDRSHVWTTSDFIYEVNEAAWEKAKAKRKERKEKANGPPLLATAGQIPEPLSTWGECQGSLERTLKKLNVSSLHEAVFGKKE